MSDRSADEGIDEEADEDARLLNSEPDGDAIDEPTTDSEQEAEETVWMMKEWVSVGAISILAMLLLAVALMQATGLVDLGGPIADAESTQWLVFAVLVATAGALFLWSRRGV